MVTGLEFVILAVALMGLVVAASIVRAVTPLLLNAAGGLLALFLAQVFLGLEVALTGLTLAVVALAGIPGAVLVLLLSVFGVAF